MLLVVTLRTSVSHKLQTTVSLTFIITSLLCRVMLVTFAVAILLSLPCPFIIRRGILGTIRVGILDQSRHQRTHIIAIALEPPELHLQGRKTTILLQH